MKSRKKVGQKRYRSLFLEPLESRVVLAGNVRAFVSGGSLNLDGDSRANEILIEQTANNQFVVSSRDGSTTINGQDGPLTFRRVSKNFDINMGNGADVVEITGSAGDVVRVRNRLFINTGSGADEVLLTEVHALGLHINTGSGRDLVNIGNDGGDNGLQVTKEAIILTGSGRDDARIANSLFKRFLVLDMGSDNDQTTVQGSDFRKRSTLNGSSGFDTINRDDNDGPLRFISYERTNKTVDTSPPLALVAVDDAATVTEDATPNTVTGNVLTNDVGGTGTKTVTAVNGASGSVGQSVNGQFGTFQINANGAFTYTLNNSNATVNALNSGQTLTDSMNYTVGDGSTTTDVGALNVTIQGTTELNAVNDTGTVTEDASPNTATGNVLTNDTGGAGTKTVTAVEGGTVGQTVNGQFGTFQINADGTFTYTLNNSNATVNALNNGGTLTDEIDYTVTAGLATDTATLTITIQGTTELNAVNDPGTVTEDDSPNTATGNVLTNDTDGAGTKTVTAVEGGTVGQTVNGQFGTFQINSDGSFTYTLNNSNATVNALNNGQTLTDSLDYTVSAGSASDTGTLTITIQGTTELAAVDDPATVTEDATPNTATGNVLTNDTGGTGTKTVTAVNGATGSVGQSVAGQFGTFNIAADGTFTYTLNNSNATVNALNNGQTLSDSLDYTVTAGAASDTGTLTVTIQGNTDVLAVDDTNTVTEDATPNTATGNVLTNDTGGTGANAVTAVNGASGSVGQVVNGQFGTFQINANGSYTYTLDNSNATVNALNNGQTLTDSIDYTVTSGSTSDTATLTITIQGTTELVAVNDAGTVTEDATANTATGNVLTNDTGGAGATTVTAVDGVTGDVGQTVNGQFGTVQINADGTYTYTLNNSNATVNALNNGGTLTDSIDYTVSAGSATDIGTLTITIQGTTELVAVDDDDTVTEDATPNTATGNVLTNDTGGTGTTTVTAVEGVTGDVGQVVNGQFGTFQINADGTYTYTLNNSNATVNALNDGGMLTDSIDYTVSAGSATDVGTLSITIEGTTELAAVADDNTVTEDATPNTATGDVLANDTGGAGAKTVTAVDGVTGDVGQVVNGDFGTFQINSDGTYIYTLNNSNATVNALNSGGTLTDEIDYTVTAGTNSDTATLTITINGADDPVAAVNDTGAVTEDDATNTSTGNVLTNDTGGVAALMVTEVDGVAGDVGQVVNGQFGTFQINSDGTFTYTLDNNNAELADLNTGETRTDSIDYTLSDGFTTDIGTLSITINGNTDATAVSADDDTGTVIEDDATDTSIGNVLTNDDGGLAALTVTAVDGLPANVGQVINGDFGTFQINSDGTFTYTLDNNNAALADLDDGETATDSIEYTAGDGTTSDIGTLTITIDGNTDI